MASRHSNSKERPQQIVAGGALLFRVGPGGIRRRGVVVMAASSCSTRACSVLADPAAGRGWQASPLPARHCA